MNRATAIAKFGICFVLAIAIKGDAAEQGIAGVWAQQSFDAKSREYVTLGKFRVKKDGGRYEMRQISKAESPIVASSDITNIKFDGHLWAFDSAWGKKGVGHFILWKQSPNVFTGQAYLDGTMVQRDRWLRVKDYRKSAEKYRKEAKQGNAVAHYILGIYYAWGQGVIRDQTLAIARWEKAAERGHAAAQKQLGLCYQNGWGVEKKPDKAIKWLRKAAKAGSPVAQVSLGDHYRSADNGKDHRLSAYWYLQAANQGYGAAQERLGYNYQLGEGVEKDLQKAAYCYKKAAQSGYPNAQNNVGLCYQQGWGVTKDLDKAADWYKKAGNRGHVRAQNSLGYFYQKGWGIDRNLGKAVKWYSKAAQQGLAQAQNNLGVCYQRGWGVKQDNARAVTWYRKAAAQGHAYAQYNLGVCYANGYGVRKNENKAIHYYRKAANQGHEDAAAKLANKRARKRTARRSNPTGDSSVVSQRSQSRTHHGGTRGRRLTGKHAKNRKKPERKTYNLRNTLPYVKSWREATAAQRENYVSKLRGNYIDAKAKVANVASGTDGSYVIRAIQHRKVMRTEYRTHTYGLIVKRKTKVPVKKLDHVLLWEFLIHTTDRRALNLEKGEYFSFKGVIHDAGFANPSLYGLSRKVYSGMKIQVVNAHPR